MLRFIYYFKTSHITHYFIYNPCIYLGESTPSPMGEGREGGKNLPWIIQSLAALFFNSSGFSVIR
jgi:hypothetical protein